MMRFKKREPADRKGWGVIARAAFLAIVAAIVLVVGASRGAAQAQVAQPGGPTPIDTYKNLFASVPTVTTVDHAFFGVFRGAVSPRGGWQLWLAQGPLQQPQRSLRISRGQIGTILERENARLDRIL